MNAFLCRAFVRVSVCLPPACVRACVRACVHACVRGCVASASAAVSCAAARLRAAVTPSSLCAICSDQLPHRGVPARVSGAPGRHIRAHKPLSHEAVVITHSHVCVGRGTIPWRCGDALTAERSLATAAAIAAAWDRGVITLPLLARSQLLLVLFVGLVEFGERADLQRLGEAFGTHGHTISRQQPLVHCGQAHVVNERRWPTIDRCRRANVLVGKSAPISRRRSAATACSSGTCPSSMYRQSRLFRVLRGGEQRHSKLRGSCGAQAPNAQKEHVRHDERREGSGGLGRSAHACAFANERSQRPATSSSAHTLV